jgi:hypothetical protein
MSAEQLVLIIIILVIVGTLVFNGKPGAAPATPGMVGTPTGYSLMNTPQRISFSPGPYGPSSPGPYYYGRGGGKLGNYSPFKNPYSVAALMVIAFAIWNFYAKKNKAEQEE